MATVFFTTTCYHNGRVCSSTLLGDPIPLLGDVSDPKRTEHLVLVAHVVPYLQAERARQVKVVLLVGRESVELELARVLRKQRDE